MGSVSHGLELIYSHDEREKVFGGAESLRCGDLGLLRAQVSANFNNKVYLDMTRTLRRHHYGSKFSYHCWDLVMGVGLIHFVRRKSCLNTLCQDH